GNTQGYEKTRKNKHYSCNHNNQAGVTEQDDFTSHIEPCYNDDLLRLVVQINIIRHIFLPYRQLLLNYRMTAIFNLQHITIRNLRLGIVVASGYLSKGQQTI